MSNIAIWSNKANWSILLLLLWTNLQIAMTNAASIKTQQMYVWSKDATTKQFKPQIEKQQQATAAASSKAQTFLELLLGIIDTLQFGKRKIGARS